MDFSYDEEQTALRDAVRGLLRRAYGDFERRRQTVRDADGPGFDRGLWAQMAEMGLLGLPFAEDDGGMGAGPVEAGIVCEEIGRVIAPEPYLVSVVLAGGAVAAGARPEHRAEILGALAAGEQLVTLAHLEPGQRRFDRSRSTTARPDGERWVLDGVKEPVPVAAAADLLIVSAALPDGDDGLFAVRPGEGVRVRGFAAADGTRAGRVHLEGARAQRIDGEGARTHALEAVLEAERLARVAAAQQSVGAQQTALEATAAYLNSRQQFGVPLKTFQALTFRAADMYVSLELARSLALWGAMVMADPSSDHQTRRAAAVRAWAQAGKAGRHIAQESIQLHGGIAMTAEYSVGSYAAHLTVLEQLLGDHRRVLGELALELAGAGSFDPIPG